MFFENAFLILCTLGFLIRYRNVSKPAFVWVMWAFFIVYDLAYLSRTIFYKVSKEANVDGETMDPLTLSYYESVNVSFVAQMGGHWVFAIQYAEVVLKLPLLVFPETSEDIQSKMNKIEHTIWTLNCVFVALVLIYTIIFQLKLFGVVESDSLRTVVFYMGPIVTLVPTGLLLVAVLKVRCMVGKLRNKAIFEKERLIMLHTVLFSLYFLVYATVNIVSDQKITSTDYTRQCKQLYLQISAFILISILNMCIFTLITYMSVQFCKPLDGQWQQFLLGYREKSLDTFLKEKSRTSTD